MFRNTIWRAFTIGYRRRYRRARAELLPDIEETRRGLEDTLDRLKKGNAKTREYLATARAVRREIAELRASHDIADAEHDEPTRLH